MEKSTILFVLLAFAFGVLITLVFVNQSPQPKVEQNDTVSGVVENISNKTEETEEHITGKTFDELKKMNTKLICDVDGQVKLYIWGDRFRTESKDESCGTYTSIYKQAEFYVQCKNEVGNATECNWTRIDTTNDVYNAGGTRVEEQFDNVEPESFDCVAKGFDVSVFDTSGKICSREDIQKQ